MRRRTKKFLIIIFSIIIILIVLIALYLSLINSAIVSSTKLTLDSIAKRAINKSVLEVSNNRAIYNDLIDIKYKETGEISLIQIKTYEANKVCNSIVETTEKNIHIFGEQGIQLKSGLFSTIPILSGLGENVSLHFKQIGAVSCLYRSEFNAAGINQNIHKLYVDITTKIGIVFPFHTEVVQVSQNILLCENVIVGEVPYTYLQSTELDSLLNLVPS